VRESPCRSWLILVSERRRRALTNADGVPVVTYVESSRHGLPWADEILVNGPGAADAVMSQMQGWVVSAPIELGEALRGRGAQVLRHAHSMARDLIADRPPARWREFAAEPGLRVVPCDRDPAELIPSWQAAFGPGHPDRNPQADEQALAQQLSQLLSGDLLGPVLPCSALVVDERDEVLAGVVVVHRGGLPWIGEVFRRPDHPGLGSALLRTVLARAADQGLSRIGLAVSDANPAREIYRRLGFRDTGSHLTVVVPIRARRT
jgi:GNAT superfamily N-acetyltransferase